ncbi:MAG: metallophosphoesterase [Gemmatimonadaceae bacterium]
MRDVVRILLLADTHLGFDLPVQPRVRRRRRGHDFLANYEAALRPALDRRVDLIVHGGDVFHRSHPPSTVAFQAFEPLTRAADAGVPVYIVPGNHERGRLPHLRFAQHPDIRIFDTPRTYVADVRGVRIALAGFPSERDDVRNKFPDLLAQTGWRDVAAQATLLCAHQCVEGATVGPADFTFTTAADVIRCRDLPSDLTGVLSGHIHRHQVLTRDLRGRPLAAPVLYPGSIERTSIAEADEAKGYMIVEVALDHDGAQLNWEFVELPARPLVVRDLTLTGAADDEAELRIAAMIREVPTDAVLTIRVTGDAPVESLRLPSAARLRDLAPETMNVELRVPGRIAGRPRPPGSHAEPVLELPLGL